MDRLNDAPRWVIALIIVLSVSVLVFFGRQIFSGQSDNLGPVKKIAPGAYDLRAEAAKRNKPSQPEAANGDWR